MKQVMIPSGDKKVSAAIHGGQGSKLAVLLPGYLDSKDYPHMVQLAEDLSRAGFTVVRFDAVGIWDSEGEYKDYSVTEYLKNVASVIEYMERHHGKPYGRIVLAGHSLGGFVSLLYAARDKRISAVVLLMHAGTPPSDKTAV